MAVPMGGTGGGRGLLQVATGLETRARPAAVPFGTMPSSGGEELHAAAGGATQIQREFEGMAAVVGRYADHAAAVDGTREGTQAGLDPEFRTRQDGTIRGEAFDKAGLHIAETRLKLSVAEQLEKLYETTKGNAQEIAKGVGAISEGTLSKTPQELQPAIALSIEGKRIELMRRAAKEAIERQNAENLGALQSDLAAGLRGISQKAFALGLDPTADAVLAGEVQQLSRVLARNGVDGKRLVTPAHAAQLLEAAKTEVATARLNGAFERLPGLEAKGEFIKQLEDDFAAGKGQVGQYDFKHFDALRHHLRSELSKDQSRARQQAHALEGLIGQIETRAKKGDDVRPDEMAALKSRLATVADPALAERFDAAEDALNFSQRLKRMPLPELEVTVHAMRQELAQRPPPVTDKGRAYARRDAAETMLREAESKLKADPLGWDAKVGMTVLQPVQTVDAKVPGALEQWGAQRLAQGRETATRHQLGHVTYWTPDERRMLSKQFEQGGEAGLAAVSMVARAFGDQADAALKELGGHGAPAGALLGRLALKVGVTPGVLDAAEGLALRARGGDGYKPVAPAATLQNAEVQSVVGTALGNAPAYEAAAKNLASAIYEVRAHREGRTQAPEPRIWDQALREALGETTINGVKHGGMANVGGAVFGRSWVVLPPSVRQDQGAAFFQALDPADFGDGGPRFANGRALTRAELRGAVPVTKEPGKYWLALKGAGTPEAEYAMGPDKRPFVLDLEAVLPAIRNRRPDLR